MSRKKRLPDDGADRPLFTGDAEPSPRVDATGFGMLLPPTDVESSIDQFKAAGLRATATILDPWYNKGVGGVRPDYDEYITSLLARAGEVSDHLFLWGFPEIIARFVGRLPEPFTLVAWLTWFYKNNPSVIRGWRSSQMACLHLSRPGVPLYLEHFLNDAQMDLKARGKLRYMPGPTSVIEEPLLVGFVGRKEQTGHPSQKPMGVYERLVLMTTRAGDLVFDPMCGSGTTGEVCARLGRQFVIADHADEYVKICEDRLGLRRQDVGNLARLACLGETTTEGLPAQQAAG